MEVKQITEASFIVAEQTIITTPLSVTMGYFDGLHRGHQKLFTKTIAMAKTKKCASAVLTFDFSQVESMKKRENHLLTEAETQAKLAAFGFDYYIVISFGEMLKSMQPMDFIEHVIKLFSISDLTVGADFHFGLNRVGNIELLTGLSEKYHYTLHTVPLLFEDNEKISSSHIEQLIVNGEINLANQLLGYPYEITGQIIYGEQKGRKIGFPTANMVVPEHKIVPPNGVYVVTVLFDGKTYNGMTNIGFAPTLKNISNHVIETNIFDFDQNIYGQELKVLFHQRIRDEQKFAGVEALKAQLEKDILYSKKYLEHNK